jgi:hypothetical protein
MWTTTQSQHGEDMQLLDRFHEARLDVLLRSLTRALAVAAAALCSVGVQAQITTDVSAPVSLVSQGPLTVDVFFHEPVTGFDASDDVALTLTGSAAVAAITIGSTSQQNYTVTLSGISGNGTLQLTVPAGRATSTTTADTNLAQSSAVITVDNTAAVVVPGPLSRTFASTVDSSPITFAVSFTDATSVELNAGKVTLSPTGTAGATVTTTTPFGTALRPTPDNTFAAPASRPHDSHFDIVAGTGLTLEAWVMPPAGFPPGFIVNYDTFSGYGMRLEPDTGGDPDVMNVACSLGFQDFITTNAPVRVGEWHHVACTVDGAGDVRLYVDAVEQFSGNFGGALTYGTDPLTVGYYFFNPFAWPASIDELRIWSVARSQGELAAGMNVPLSGTTGLLGYWQFDALEDLGVGSAGSNDIRDLSGNAKHLDTEPGISLVEGNALYGATVSLSNFAGNGTLSVGLVAGIARDAAGNQSAAVSVPPDISVTMSATAPQILSITPDVASPTNADVIRFRVVFSEPVTGFAVDDLVISKPGVSIVSTAITPVDGSNYDVQVDGIGGNGVLIVGVRAGAVQNGALLSNTSQVDSAPLAIDNAGPNPTLSSVTTSPLDGSPFIVNINFDEAVAGFAVSDLAATNAALSGFAGSGASYSVVVTPVSFGDVTIGMTGFGAVLDLAGNPGSQGNTLTWSYPAPTPPTIAQVIAPTIANTPTFSIEIVFSEDIVGFELADLSFSVGSASCSTTSLARLSSSHYRLDFGECSGQGEIAIAIAAGSISDTDGTPNGLLTITQQVDLVAPNVLSSSVSPSAGSGIGGVVTFRIVTDEIVSAFDASLITVISTGDAGYLALQTGRVVVESTVVRIQFSHSGNGSLAIQLQPGALIDRAGNASTGTHSTSPVIVDNTAPQLLSLQPSIAERQLAPATVYFEGVLSEPVTIGGGFTVDYQFLTVSNPEYPADLSSLVRVGIPELITPERFRVSVDLSRLPYKADLNLWLVAQLVLRDGVGNEKRIVDRRSDSPVIIDLLLTEATISTRRKVTNQSPIPISVQFTSATIIGFPTDVTGFDLGDLNLTNATASNLTGSGANYSFDLTPTSEGEVSVWISPAATRDADNRPNIGTEIFYVQYDVTPPEILAVEAKTTGNPNNDPGFLVYFRVSEPLDKPTLLSAVSISLVNSGSLRSFVEDASLDVPGVEVLRIGHFPGEEGVPALGTVDFSVPAGAVTDLAGNAATTPFALPEPVSVDRKPPSVTAAFTYVEGSNPIFITSNSISATEVTAEFTFDEPVVDFQKSDVLIEKDSTLGYSDTSFVVVSPTVARLTVLNVASDGVLTISLKEGGVTDALGNGNVETGRFSININNIPTEVVSITPETAEFDDDETSFVVEWSKPVSRFDESKFLMTGRSGFAAPVTRRSITFTPLDDDSRGNSLRVRVDLQGLEGGGEFALEVLEAAAVDRFDNPNLAGFTGPFVRRIAPFELGPFDILGAESDEFGDYVGRPDLTINGVFALRGTEEGPARLRWDGRFLSMRGRFEVLTEPAMELFSSVGNQEVSIDSETGEFDFPSARSLPLGGASGAFSPCRARLVLDGRALRLSGSLFPVDGYIGEAFLDPRFPGSRIVLDVVSEYFPFSPSSSCTPVGSAFQVLGSEPASAGLAVDVRAHWDLVGDGSDEPALLEGRVELRAGSSPLLTNFTVRLTDFDWQAPDAQDFGVPGPALDAASLRFPRLRR